MSILQTRLRRRKGDGFRSPYSLTVCESSYVRHNAVFEGVNCWWHVSSSKISAFVVTKLMFGELTHLNVDDMSRNMYLFLPTTLMKASSFRRTMRSQRTTSFFTCGSRLKQCQWWRDWQLTPLALSYSASKYRNNCLVFQLKRGVRSCTSIRTMVRKIANILIPAVILKLTKVRSCTRLGYRRALEEMLRGIFFKKNLAVQIGSELTLL